MRVEITLDAQIRRNIMKLEALIVGDQRIVLCLFACVVSLLDSLDGEREIGPAIFKISVISTVKVKKNTIRSFEERQC